MPNFRLEKGIVRKSFGKIETVVPVPNLIDIQSSSFNDFVQLDFLPDERKSIGLERVLRDVFPINHDDKLSLEYVSYELGHWACTCGRLTGIEKRYQWNCFSCKKSGCSRLVDGKCPLCQENSARYQTCVNCLSRVVVKLPMGLDECRLNGQTFSMPLKIKIQLVTWAKDESGVSVVQDVKEQDIFFVDLPIMADLYEDSGQFKLGNLGTFLINGVDRVIVSQLHRSSGVIFSQSKKVKDLRGKPYYLARLIPMRGSWIDFEFDSNDYLYVRVDKKKKVFVTTFLQALGISRGEILNQFYQFDVIHFDNGDYIRPLDYSLVGQRIESGMLPSKYEKDLMGQRFTADTIDRLKKAGIETLYIREQTLIGRVLGKDLYDSSTNELLIKQGESLHDEQLQLLRTKKNFSLSLIQVSGYALQPVIALTLMQDRCNTQDEAFRELHSKIWPGDSVSTKEVKERFENLFFNSRYYDLTKVGRIRINRKLGLTISTDVTVLTKEDIIATIRYLVNLRERGEGELDDIDHLSNRRVRLAGELYNNQMYVGFMRIERIVRERFRIQETHGALMPQDFLNVKPLGAVIREFFGLGQLSQFMDQTNPLSEIAHKRRLSALGPGGVLKDRATFEVRDVHSSHYGRICPIETPEGQTVGLISSLATYATVNDLGFIETAYRRVKKGVVQDDVVLFDAFDEAPYYIAQADMVEPGATSLLKGKVFARHDGNFVQVDSDKVDYVDLSPKQLISVSAALIPFLEHDDAVRALMGANMQRQAVPLIKAQPPIVGTGMEKEIIKASGAVISARRGGIVEYVSAERIVIRVDDSYFEHPEDKIANGIDLYCLRKFQRSSYSTLIHHSPIVAVGDFVAEGSVITNGSAVVDGELALGSNLQVAFMLWNGYNFEDAIVLNERLVSEDVLTSVHIDEYVVDARDTKLGPEEITRDIPNVSEQALEGLDDDGIVRIGTRVKPGDILVGKVTLKGDIQYSPEEKLLRAIFGERSREVRDTSLRVPPGIEGTVIDVKIFSRSGIKKDKRYKQEVTKQIEKIESDFALHVRYLKHAVKDQVLAIVESPQDYADQDLEEIWGVKTKNKTIAQQIKQLKTAYENQLRILDGLKEERIGKFRKGDSLPSGVIKVVKVYIAMKRPVSVGDKVAGRHGNKGVVSTIVPREDMPYTEDGTPVDIVLNPLGVPSRMNVGQILETALGFVGKNLAVQVEEALDQGYSAIKKSLIKSYGSDLIDSYEKTYGKDAVTELARKTAKRGVLFSSPVFDSADLEGDIQPILRSLGMSDVGSYKLKDGLTGEYFDQPVTVGTIYMMKLNHMVDDKLHARSVGPYSLVTQQPLGGKAQQGGQRLGEMEVWALEAYGSAYTLQEMLTYKSDDMTGRHKAYQAIVRGEDVPEPGVPESFNVLIKELQSLGLQVDLLKVGKENVGE